MPTRGTLEHQMYSTMCRLYELVFIQHRQTEERVTALEDKMANVEKSSRRGTEIRARRKGNQ